MLVPESHAREPQESIDLQPIRVVVSNAEQLRIGIKGQH
jgi:hypothetical protein